MTKQEFFQTAARSLLSSESTDEEVLALMLVLHTHCFHLPETIELQDAGKARVLAALTRHGAAEIVASAFPKTKKQSQETFWFWEFNESTPFSGTFEMPQIWKDRVDKMITRLKQCGLFKDVIEEN